jgi:DNA mismatch endonuclease, patch repair protein
VGTSRRPKAKTTSSNRARPAPLNGLVSDQMSRMPRHGTKPEMTLRRELHRRGLRFRTSLRGIPGSPDIALTKAKIGVFVDGCFWHACPDHGGVPKNNRDWWAEKLEGNRQRDQRKDAALRALGWLPVHVWEHEDMATASVKIERLWRQRKNPRG